MKCAAQRLAIVTSPRGCQVPGELGPPGAQRSPHRAWWPAPPTWGCGPSNDSVQRVGGGGRGGGGRLGLFRAPQLPAKHRAAAWLRRGSSRCRPRRRCGTQGSAALAEPDPGPPDRTMRAAPPPARLLPLLLLLALLAAPAARASRAESAAPPQSGSERQPRPPPGPGPGNATGMGSGEAAGGGGGGSSNSSGDALVTRISSLLRDLPTLKAAVIVACAFSAFLIACLLLRVFRWVRRPFAAPAGQLAPPTCCHCAPAAPARTDAPAPPGCAPASLGLPTLPHRVALGWFPLLYTLGIFSPSNDISIYSYSYSYDMYLYISINT